MVDNLSPLQDALVSIVLTSSTHQTHGWMTFLKFHSMEAVLGKALPFRLRELARFVVN